MKKLLLLFLLSVVADVSATYANMPLLTAYRWRNDDGNEANATWRQALSTQDTLTSRDENIRLRLLARMDGSESSYNLILAYSTTGNAPFVPITSTSSHFVVSDSPHEIHETPTTYQIGGDHPGGNFWIIAPLSFGLLFPGSP